MVRVEIWGPSGSTVGLFALDTGASSTCVNEGLLLVVGITPAEDAPLVSVTTGAQSITVPRVTVARLEAFGIAQDEMSILAHTLPATAALDGLLGLDFFRGTQLQIDFRNGLIDVS